MKLAAVLLVAVLGAGAADARAGFSPPVQLATGGDGLRAIADSDAAGTTTAVIAGAGGAARLVERPPGGAWSAGARLPGDPHGVAGPVLDAAGNGALAIAWRVDRPRRYSGIAVALRDPGGALSDPISIAGDDANGVRHPALAIDAAGDALLAYDTGTRAAHLSMRGQIAVAYRPRGGRFTAPVVVDRELAGAPAIALAPDGSGIVAWVRGHRMHAVSIGTDGRPGKAKALVAAPGLGGVVAAADSGGAATIAWASHHEADHHRGVRYDVRVLRRAAGRAFGAARTVASSRAFTPDVAIAADEHGRVTLAWSEQRFGPTTAGAVRTATAPAGQPFAAPRTIAVRGARVLDSPSIAASGGRVAVGWSFVEGRRRVGVQAAVGPAVAPGPAQTVADVTLKSNFFLRTPAVTALLPPRGPATLVFAQPAEPAGPGGLTFRLLSTDGS